MPAIETTQNSLEQQVIEMVRTTVAQVLSCDKEKVTLQSAFAEDLGADSFDRVALVLALEARFGRTLSEEVARRLKCVRDVVQFILSNHESI